MRNGMQAMIGASEQQDRDAGSEGAPFPSEPDTHGTSVRAWLHKQSLADLDALARALGLLPAH